MFLLRFRSVSVLLRSFLWRGFLYWRWTSEIYCCISRMLEVFLLLIFLTSFTSALWCRISSEWFRMLWCSWEVWSCGFCFIWNSCVDSFCEWPCAFAYCTLHGAVEETQKWRSVTIAAYIMCIGMGAYTLSHEEHHESENPVSNFWFFGTTLAPDFVTWLWRMLMNCYWTDTIVFAAHMLVRSIFS